MAYAWHVPACKYAWHMPHPPTEPRVDPWTGHMPGILESLAPMWGDPLGGTPWGYPLGGPLGICQAYAMVVR